jgi:WD40 repeat protein
MDPSEAIKIFLSYARKDGGDLARRLHDDLKARGFAPWLDKHRIGGGASWTDDIEQALDAAALFLAVMTHGSYESEICRAEQLRALRKGKLVIPLLGQSDPDVVPLYFETRNYRDLSANYAAAFSELLDDIANGRSPGTLAAKYRSTPYNTVPALPLNYVERASELRALRDALITDGDGRHIALTALRGMGGIGKSILAQALCHDPVVQQAFPDGIVWLIIGRESTTDTLTRLREAAKALRDDLAHYENETAAKNRFRSILRDQAVLIVLDDVWDAYAVEPFSGDSPRSRLLITTRDGSIAAGTGATEHIADLLTEADARSVLSKWSGVAVGNQPSEAAALIRETGRLPLALAMIGAMLRGKPEKYWARVVTLLQEADLAKIRAQFPDYPHHDLFRAMEVGVAALDETTRVRYMGLAVTLEEMVIERPVQRTLWGCDEGEALDTAEMLIGLSLAERVGEDGAIRLHDLQLDFLRARWPDREALQLIHGALQLSMHVLAEDSGQFSSQMVGRLLTHRDKPGVAKFMDEITAAAPLPWFRPLYPCFDAPGGALLRTLVGHSHWVDDVSVTPDGKRAVSASADCTLKVWDLDTGRCLRTLEGHRAQVKGVAVTPDGKRVVSASYDHTLKVWDLETGRVLHTLEGHSLLVYAVAVTPDGKRAVSASFDDTLKVWDLDTGRALYTLVGHSSTVERVVVTPDGKRAVSASGDKTLKVWDLETGRALLTLEGHSAPVLGVTVTLDGKRAVSASYDKTLKVWDLDTGRALRTMEGHAGIVSGVAIMPDEKRAVSTSGDKTLKVWDLATGRCLRTLEGHSAPVLGVTVTLNGKRAVSASWDKTLKVWDPDIGCAPRVLDCHSGRVSGIAVVPDGRRAVSASWDKTLKVWDLDTGRALLTLEGHSAEVWGVAVTPDGKRAVSASYDNTLKVWDLETCRALRTLKGHFSHVYAAAMTADGKRAVSASADNTLKVWDLETGRVLRALEGHSDSVDGVSVTLDGKRAVSASHDKTLKVWDLEAGTALRSLEGHSDSVDGVSVTLDGKRAVSASHDKTLKVWDLEAGAALRTLEGHSASVAAAAVTPDGKRVVSASWDNTLKVWDLNTGLLVATFYCDGSAHCCAFADAHRIVAGDGGGRVYFLALEE